MLAAWRRDALKVIEGKIASIAALENGKLHQNREFPDSVLANDAYKSLHSPRCM